MSNQPLTIDAFRKAFPSFTSELYPDEAVNIRLIISDKLFSPTLWNDSDMRNHVMGLYTAHFLQLYGSKNCGGTGSTGGVSGLVTGKSVDGASVSYDTSTGSFADAGFWNLTPYGQELWYLMGLFGAGARQL